MPDHQFHIVTPAEMSRRSFLGTGVFWSVGLVGLAAASLGRAHRQKGPGLVETIHSLYGDPEAAAPIARASGWDRERALGVLTRTVPLTSGGEAARMLLEGRVRTDFVEDRIQLVGRRWLSETEVAIAVVLFGKAD